VERASVERVITQTVRGEIVTCFFDASHGPGTQEISWTPQWGVPRPVRTCAVCAQRWTDHLRGGQGYPQPGYPQAGYPQPGYGYPPEYPPQRRGYGTGAVVAAGAAGFVGGMVVNEMFDNDEIVEHIDVVDDYGDYGGDW
jgi:tellurium resistance protein TerD